MNTKLPPQRGSSCHILVKDIQIWLQCFVTLPSVIISKHPEKASHLFDHTRMIVQASRNFEDLAWVSYDANFRRQSANHKSWDWGNIDPAMFNEAFYGRTKLKPRCKQSCWSDRQCLLSTTYPTSTNFRTAPWYHPPQWKSGSHERSPTYLAIGLIKAPIMLSSVDYLTNQWPMNVDTRIANISISVPCAVRPSPSMIVFKASLLSLCFASKNHSKTVTRRPHTQARSSDQYYHVLLELLYQQLTLRLQYTIGRKIYCLHYNLIELNSE